MRTENGQQESKQTRRARGEGRKQSATKKPTPKAPRPKSSATTGTGARKSASRSAPRASAPSPVERNRDAEEIVDRLGAQIGRFATLVGHEILRAAARAREEIEDMVAEAQSIRDSIQVEDSSHAE
jgi:hypothetical protein